MATAAASSALAALVAANPRELHRRRADGSRLLDSLYETCRVAGLCPPARGGAGAAAGRPGASADEERYFLVFDAALQNQLGCWVQDYVEVVCADRHLTSNDPLEAWLLDGDLVKAWSCACLQRAEQAAVAALTSDHAFGAFAATQLQQQLAQARVLVSVLKALDRIRSGSGRGTSAGSGGGIQDRRAAGAGGGWGAGLVVG